MKLSGMVLADLHIGALPLEQTYKEINYLKDTIKDSSFDFIIIAGDYFDKKIYSGDEYIVIANDLFLYLLEHCNKLRAITGTSSHDNKQYSIFRMYERNQDDIIGSEDIDYRLIETVSEEELFPGLQVLYIPEEYVYDKEEYYKEYFVKKKYYDYVFGHGVIAEGMANAVRNQKKSKEHRRKAPIFKTVEFEYICKGQTYFGHYHTHTNLHDTVFYVGSWCRDKFGEEEPKGFYKIFAEEGKYTNEFMPNTVTEQYTTISFGYNHKIFKEDTDLVKEFKEIQKKRESLGIEHMRLLFNIPNDYPNGEFFINLANDTFGGLSGYKVEVSNGYIEMKRQVNKEKFREVKKKFHYVFDENAKIEDVLSNFTKAKQNREIPPERVKEYMTFDAVDLLQR